MVSAEHVVRIIFASCIVTDDVFWNTSVGSKKQEKDESSISDDINCWKNDVEDDWDYDSLQLLRSAQWNFSQYIFIF